MSTGVHAWQRGTAGWHAVFALLAALSGVLLAGETGLAAPARYAALGLLVLLCGWYAALGTRALHRESPALGMVYLAVAAPLTVAVFWLVPACALMLCVLYPHLWALLPVRRAIAGTVAVLAAVAAGMLSHATPGGVVPALAFTVAGLAIALLLGLWISRIIEQSRQRADLVAELAATRSELAEVSRQAGALAERARVARDIHDTLAQGFASVLLQLEAVAAELGDGDSPARRHVVAAQTTARANLAEARSLVGALTPPDLRAASLVDAVRRLVARRGQELGVSAGFSVTGSARVLPANHEVVLFRAVQEALTNVGKHAAASTVCVELGYRAGGVALTVRDDGRGLLPGNGSGGGYGLAGMRARAAEVGGALAVDTAPGGGLTLRLDLPDVCP
jgi:signal transduction histidine kinase